MDDMQRYRDIKATATEDDPTAKLRAYLTVAFDQALAEAIRLERQGKPGKVRALGFTATADLLDEPFTDVDVELVAEALAASRGDQCFDFDGPQWDGTKDIHRMDARAVLYALSATGQHRGKTTTGRATQ